MLWIASALDFIASPRLLDWTFFRSSNLLAVFFTLLLQNMHSFCGNKSWWLLNEWLRLLFSFDLDARFPSIIHSFFSFEYLATSSESEHSSAFRFWSLLVLVNYDVYDEQVMQKKDYGRCYVVFHTLCVQKIAWFSLHSELLKNFLRLMAYIFHHSQLHNEQYIQYLDDI